MVALEGTFASSTADLRRARRRERVLFLLGDKGSAPTALNTGTARRGQIGHSAVPGVALNRLHELAAAHH